MGKRKLALFDIDKTVYDGYVIFPVAEKQVKEKIIKKSCLEELYNDLRLYKEGEVDYEETITNLVIHWTKGLKGISYNSVLQQTTHFLMKEGNNFFPFLKTVTGLLQETHDIYFVTGEPQFVAAVVTDLFKATGYFSSELEVKDNIFTGKVKTFLAKRKEKAKAMKSLLTKHAIKDSLAFGDSEGDLDMLKLVEHRICINATPGLRKIATERGWYISKPEEVEKIISDLLTLTET